MMKTTLHLKTTLQKIRRFGAELGVMGRVSLGVLVAAAIFMAFVLQPLQEKNRALQSKVARQSPAAQQAGNSSEKLGALYGYLEKPEATTDWLAKLYAIGKATGVELQSANYRTQKAEGRLERYEIVLPLTGSYAQMRDFLKRSLAEIPVLSLDQITLKRETRRDGAVQAEVRMTLHKVKS
jgi:Tfp pilus assembly protein PilO